MALRDLRPAPVGHGRSDTAASQALREEIIQEGMLHLLAACPRLRGLQKDKLPGYLAVTVRNTTYNLLKKEARDQKLFVPLHAQNLPDDGPTLEEQMLHSEALDELFTICDQLRPIDRSCSAPTISMTGRRPSWRITLAISRAACACGLSRARRQVKQRMLESG